MTTLPPTDDTFSLRVELVSQLRARGAIRTRAVLDALADVPRHLFLPGVPTATAYADEPVVTKEDPETGAGLSSASQPRVVATMLEQAEVRSGDRVLEIGAGTGYNAALLSYLVGPGGEVTAVDIDHECVTAAQKTLATTGWDGGVRVLQRDGKYGATEHAPYHVIQVTVGAPDLPPAWLEQLAPEGRLVVPLRFRGLSRSIAFTRADGCLVSRSVQPYGFVAMQGEGEQRQHTVSLSENGLQLRVDDSQETDGEALAAALKTGRAEERTGVTLTGSAGVLPSLDLWLATAMDTYGRLHTSRRAVQQPGLDGAPLPNGSSATWTHSSFAYLGIRAADTEDDDGGRYELGVHAYGPERGPLAAELAEQIRTWDREQRDGPGPTLRAYPAGTPDERLAPGRVIAKQHTRLVISWPK